MGVMVGIGFSRAGLNTQVKCGVSEKTGRALLDTQMAIQTVTEEVIWAGLNTFISSDVSKG